MKRRLRTLILLLVLGAIVNVAVAWGCAMWVDPANGRPRPLQWGGDKGQHNSEVSTAFLDWNVALDYQRGGLRAISRWRDTDTEEYFIGLAPTGSAQELVPPWGGFLVPPQIPETAGMTHIRKVEGWGWPMLSAFTTWANEGPVFPGNYPARLGSGIAMSVATRTATLWISQVPRALPVLPICPGFAINTMFYAGVLWVVFVLPFTVRRWRRINRGLCPACAYPVGQSPICTECGRTVARRMTA